MCIRDRYNSLPNDVNPEGVRGNLSGEFRIRSFDPYTANYTMTIKDVYKRQLIHETEVKLYPCILMLPTILNCPVM